MESFFGQVLSVTSRFMGSNNDREKINFEPSRIIDVDFKKEPPRNHTRGNFNYDDDYDKLLHSKFYNEFDDLFADFKTKK